LRIADKSRSSGMTLIEVLLAVAIAGTALVILTTGAARCVAVFHRARDYQEAQWYLGLGELENPLFMTNDIKGLEVSETEYGDGYYFSRVVEDDEDEDELFLVKTTVRWERGPRVFREEIARYVLQAEQTK
jgi:prepilin-type N-terminal cleavage/methylation domain-containing protein